MKIRTCFVSNSSSSSFVVRGTDVEEIRNRIARALDSCPQLKGMGNQAANDEKLLRLYPITSDLKANDRRRICRDIHEYTCWMFRPSELKTGTTRVVTAENALYELEQGDESRMWEENPETWQDPVEALDREFGTTHRHLG